MSPGALSQAGDHLGGRLWFVQDEGDGPLSQSYCGHCLILSTYHAEPPSSDKDTEEGEVKSFARGPRGAHGEAYPLVFSLRLPRGGPMGASTDRSRRSGWKKRKRMKSPAAGVKAQKKSSRR